MRPSLIKQSSQLDWFILHPQLKNQAHNQGGNISKTRMFSEPVNLGLSHHTDYVKEHWPQCSAGQKLNGRLQLAALQQAGSIPRCSCTNQKALIINKTLLECLPVAWVSFRRSVCLGLQGPGKGSGFNGSGVTSSCELYSVGAGNRTWVFCKSSKCF